MSRQVSVSAGSSRYGLKLSIGPHLLHADEPTDVGGHDAGPNPYELLLAALGACTGMTLRMYAARKKWPLEDVRVRLSHAKAHADDCVNCDTQPRMIDHIEMEISFLGDLTDEQKKRLMDIAGKCPVHRTLTSPSRIRSQFAVESDL